MGAKPRRAPGVDGRVSRQRGMARNHASRPAAPSATKIARQPKPAAMAAPSIGPSAGTKASMALNRP